MLSCIKEVFFYYLYNELQKIRFWGAGSYMLEEKEKFDATKYKNDFQKEKYDRIIVNVPKGQKEIISETAKKQGYKSLNSFIVDAINDKISN